MKKRKKFEAAYAKAHGLKVEDFHQYREGETYRLPMIAKCWRFWCMALDANLDPEASTSVKEEAPCKHCGWPHINETESCDDATARERGQPEPVAVVHPDRKMCDCNQGRLPCRCKP